MFGGMEGAWVGNWLPPIMQANDQRHAAENANIQAREAAANNIAMQKEFAQHGIRWKVEDAKAAGIHPMYALGAQGASFSPVTTNLLPEESGLGEAAAKMGQNITRAVNATSTQFERQSNQLQLESLNLDNQIKAAQLQNLKQVGPPMAGSDNFMPGQGNSGLVVDKPLERTVSAPGRPAQEAGWRPDVAYSRTDTGMTPVVPQSLSESLEDDIIGKAMWRWRNQFVPNFTAGREGKPPDSMLPDPKRQYWDWSFTRQEWQPHTWDKRR